MNYPDNPLFVGLDLDYTALNTDKFFYEGVLPLLAEAFDVNPAEFRNSMDRYRTQFGPANDYDFFRQLNDSGLNSDEVEAQIIHALASDELLLPGVKQLVDIQQHNAADLRIITLGEDRYQRLKVACAPTLAQLAVHTMLEPKGDYIHRHFADRRGYQIDDAHVVGLPPGIRHLQVISRNTKNPLSEAYADMRALLKHGPAELVELTQV